MTSQLYLPPNQSGEPSQGLQVEDLPVSMTRCGRSLTHPVVEGVLRSGHAAVVAAVRLRGDSAPCWLVEGSGEGGGGRARRRHLTVHGGGAGLGLLQGEGWVRDPTHIHLLPGSTNIWIRKRENIWIRERVHIWIRETNIWKRERKHLDQRENI